MTTVTELPPVSATPPRKWYKGPVGISVGVFAVAVVAVSAIAATSGSGVPVGGMHSPADQQLASDGYSFVKDMTGSNLAGADGLITSAAIGTRGSDMEGVFEMSSPGVASLFEGAELPQHPAAVHITVNGAVLRLYGPTKDVLAYATNL